LKILKPSTPLLFTLENHILVVESFLSVHFMKEKKSLAATFDNEVAGWERALAYESNREKLR
jgi:hypothetical protein